MNPSLKPVVEAFIAEEQLPPEYFGTVEKWFLPMVDEVLQHIAAHQGTFIIGVSGCQGSGKSTLAALIVRMLNRMLGLRCLSLSIDDFYLTRAERQALAHSVHPLLATRGVPGTHDIALAIDTITRLCEPGEVAVPRFDKAVDDRLPKKQWPVVRAPLDIIVLEGWCLSVDAQPEGCLAEPVNELESREDPDGTWRRYVNAAIHEQYAALYGMLDYLILLKAPAFEKVYEWRQIQENKLAEKFHAEKARVPGARHRLMTADELKRFIQHYERVTRHGMETLPAKANVVFQLTDLQTIDRRL